MKRVIVVGGGASGMISAYYSAMRGMDVVLIERNEKLGKKIYITGKGRCNVTASVDSRDFLQNIPTNPKFLQSAIYSFSPSDMMELLNRYGLELVVERGNRVFPKSQHASDVIKTLTRMLDEANVKVKLNERVKKISKTNEIFDVETDLGSYECDAVIIATGGFSYKMTGSSGDGYAFAKSLGHKVTPLLPALVGIETKENLSSLAGLSLKNVSLTAYLGEKALGNEFGEILFTHTGLSGPIVLSLSSIINKKPLSEIRLVLDLKPALDEKTLDNRILRDFEKNKNKEFKNSLDELLPKSLIPFIIERSGISKDKKVNSITAVERQRLLFTLKNLEFKVKKLGDIDTAIVTSGGVDVKEINPKNMESKLVKNLHFTGEVIDVDGLTGGYNLQIAFSTGYLAGNNILND